MTTWYKKGYRHYGPKPNTRRARGLPKRKHIYHKFVKKGSIELRDSTERYCRSTILRYVRIYNYYHKEFAEHLDEDIAAIKTIERYKCTRKTLYKAIDYILKVVSSDEYKARADFVSS